MAATTRDSTLVLKSGGTALPVSRIRLYSRPCGAFLEAEASVGCGVLEDDLIEVIYKDEEGESLLATVKVFSVPQTDGKLKLSATDPYRDCLKTVLASAGWRKASIKEIAEAVLQECDVDKYDLSGIPSITLPHFSYHAQNGWTVIGMLTEAALASDGTGLSLLPAPDGTLVFGSPDSVVPQTDYRTAFSSDDATRRGNDHLKLHLLPLLHAQEMSFDGVRHTVRSVIHTASPSARETDVWI